MGDDIIVEPTIDYNFAKLYLGPPSSVAGGAYLTKIMYDNNKSLLIQTPKCLTKQGFFVKSGNKVHVDLMFDNNDTVFIQWIEQLEARMQELIYGKKNTWFDSKLERDEIENAFTPPFRLYKSGKYYLMRVNAKPTIKIYNEQKQLIAFESVREDQTLICILEIHGLKFSPRNFQMEIELKQAMVVSPDPFLDKCFIKLPAKSSSSLEDLVEQSVQELVQQQAPEPEPEPAPEPAPEPEPEPQQVIKEEEEEDSTLLKEIDVQLPLDDTNSLEEILTLKNPNSVYYEMYQKAREKAKEAKRNAILAFLEMKKIKKTYELDDIDESDSSDFGDFECLEEEDNGDNEEEEI